MVYGFISDTLFHSKSVIDLGNNPNPAVGYLDSEAENYFHTKACLSDNRATRLSVLGPVAPGELRVYFDHSKFVSPSLFETITPEQQQMLLDIIERIYLSQSETKNDLDYSLSHDARYAIYVPTSVNFSAHVTEVTVPFAGFPGNIAILNIRDYVSFSIKIGEVTTDFKLWLNRDAFFTDYPLSTIVSVILPCDPKYLLDPAQLNTPLDTLSKTSQYVVPLIDRDIKNYETSGLAGFTVRYNYTATNIVNVTFSVSYQGTPPSTLQMRQAIRAALESSNLADASIWESLFPDLYVEGQFFIIPLYHNEYLLPDRIVFPSVIKANKLKDIACEVFPNYDGTFVNDHLEMIVNGYNTLFALVVPDPNNSADRLDFVLVHPTYQYFQPQNPAHAYMDLPTREFNVKFNRCMAALAGELVSGEFSTNRINDAVFLAFTANRIEYNVLTKDSYKELVPTEVLQ